MITKNTKRPAFVRYAARNTSSRIDNYIKITDNTACFLNKNPIALYGPIAQLVEQRPFKPRVASSSLAGPSKLFIHKNDLVVVFVIVRL